MQVHEPSGQPWKEQLAPVPHCAVQCPDAQSMMQVAPSAHVSAQPPGAHSSVQFPPAVHDVLQPPPAQSMVQSALPGGHAEHTPFAQVTVHGSTPQLDPLLLPPNRPPLEPPYPPLSVEPAAVGCLERGRAAVRLLHDDDVVDRDEAGDDARNEDRAGKPHVSVR